MHLVQLLAPFFGHAVSLLNVGFWCRLVYSVLITKMLIKLMPSVTVFVVEITINKLLICILVLRIRGN